ncbi:hypothetical protein LRAMOSA09319 [Lichtheimia ramosa]|uniref:Oxidase FUB9 n=1 Tax=Lichtheimia ramosa TaxID=688394 RepID=A0A077WHZ9_9FUNG|nr:hypothetical protein LRAMOSA09319 [Lichtheimia ramosa]
MSKPVCLDDYEAYARQKMAAPHFGFFCTGAEDEVTLRRNKEAYNELIIRPRVMVNVKNIDLSTSILGQRIKTPICIAPTSNHRLAHPEGEKATVRASAAYGTCFCLSSYSNYGMETVVKEATKVDPNSLQWFQLYVDRDRKVTEQMVRRCEKAGFKAIVLTVDLPTLGRRLTEERAGFKLPDFIRFGNFQDEHSGRGPNRHFGYDVDATLNWKDVSWLKSITNLPIVVKGVLRGDDAALAVKHGAQGIIVSNHGGRQLDHSPASIEALPEIIEAVRGTSVEVYVDGGIRHGSDVFKALALGARAVFLGRPIIYGLAYNGEDGVKQVLSQINKDLTTTMTLAVTHIQIGFCRMYFHQSDHS